MKPLPRGAQFFRCALQVNPSHYGSTFRGAAAFPGSEDEFVSAMLAAAQQAGVNVLGITDHHSVASVELFGVKAEAVGITVFPGFEATSHEGVHVLCLFAPRTPRAHLDRHLGRLQVEGDGIEARSKLSFVDILETVQRDLGGVCIAPHILTAKQGLLGTLTGQARVKAWCSPYLLAAAIPSDVESVKDLDFKRILEGSDANYQRQTPIALINALDVVRPEDLRDNPRTRCRLKMTTPTIEGLRQAFLDPKSRVRADDGQQRLPWPRLLGIQWTGGFLDGVAIAFNDNLNVLIGGRGTGKSAVIESIRHALDLDVHADHSATHRAFVEKVIGRGNQITVAFKTGGEKDVRYVVHRTVGDPPRVMRDDVAVRDVRPRDLINPVLMGQGELALLAEDKTARTRLLERFKPGDGANERKKAEIKKRLQRSRETILALKQDVEDDRGAVAKLVSLRAKLQHFEGLDLERRLADRTRLAKERQLFAEAEERIASLRTSVEDASRQLPLDTTFLGERVLADLPGREHLAAVAAALASLSTDVTARLEGLAAAVQQGSDQVTRARTDWSVRERQVEAEYRDLLRDLQREGVRNAAEFVELKDGLQALEPREARLRSQEELLAKARQDREALLTEWDALLLAEHQRSNGAARIVRQGLKRVQVTVNWRGDRQPLWRLLKENLDRFSTDRLADAESISPRELADTIRGGPDALVTKYSLTRAQAEKLSAGGEALALLVEELELPTTTEIEFDTTGGGAWQRLENLSKGQRASAILLILLLAGQGEATPLILDQPEDDLDNRFVFDGIVPQLKSAKEERQFLFSTHNANIPVLGDAELIVSMDVKAVGRDVVGYVDPERAGSIDVDKVRQSVEDVLEGGKTAFLLRKAKYHF